MLAAIALLGCYGALHYTLKVNVQKPREEKKKMFKLVSVKYSVKKLRQIIGMFDPLPTLDRLRLSYTYEFSADRPRALSIARTRSKTIQRGSGKYGAVDSTNL